MSEWEKTADERQPEAGAGLAGHSAHEFGPVGTTETETAAPLADEPEVEPEPRETIPTAEPKPAKGPPNPLRSLVRLGWALVVVLVVLAVVAVAGMLRISNEINRVACIQRAQTNYTATSGRNASAYQIGLANLSVRISLKKCG